MGQTLSILVFVSALCCCQEAAGPRGQDSEEKAQPSPAYRVDGQKALGYIQDIIAFGPRHPGTAGAEKTRQYIAQKLASFGLTPRRQEFIALTPHRELGRVKMANIYVDMAGQAPKKTVLLGGHFDGKIIEGMEFQGANDGGSSTGLLLEMARVLAAEPPPGPVRIVFFDGEEALVRWSDSDSRYGSKRMAAKIRRDDQVGRYAAVVIVDMIGDKRLRIEREALSHQAVFSILERTAQRLGHGSIFQAEAMSIADDHTPFLQIGIPAAVLIDLRYGPGYGSNAYWHTDQDTLDKLSPRSMEIVGQVVLESLPELASLTR